MIIIVIIIVIMIRRATTPPSLRPSRRPQLYLLPALSTQPCHIQGEILTKSSSSIIIELSSPSSLSPASTVNSTLSYSRWPSSKLSWDNRQHHHQDHNNCSLSRAAVTPPLGGGGSVLGISPHSPSLHQVPPLTYVFLKIDFCLWYISWICHPQRHPASGDLYAVVS